MVNAIEKLYHIKMSAIRFQLKEDGVYREILKTGKAQVNNDSFVIQQMGTEYTDDKTLHKFLPTVVRIMGLRSVISVPLVSDGESIGLLDIARHEPLTGCDMERIQTIASQFVNVIKRKQAENKLKENEEKYRLIVENTRDLIFTIDSANKYIYVSPSIKTMLGYEPAEIAGQPFISLVHPDDRHIIDEEVRISLLPGYRMSGNCEYRVRHASGGWRWHNGTGSIVRDENGNPLYFLGVARDITERKQTEEALKASEENFRNSLDKSPIGVRIVDAGWNTLYAIKYTWISMDIKTLLKSTWLSRINSFRLRSINAICSAGRKLCAGNLSRINWKWIFIERTALSGVYRLPDRKCFGTERHSSRFSIVT
jgi:PAS domain S-box-containing protein